MNPRKKVLLLVIDALSAHVFNPALAEGRLPHFRALAQAGTLDTDSCAIFPSITHAALTSLITGTYPAHHGIPGGHWFDRTDEHIVNYAGDPWTILNEGIESFLLDFLLNLNHDQLKGPTLFEMVERAGLRACCINYLIHRGDSRHEVNAPLLLKLLPGMNQIEEIRGPAMLYVGDFVQGSAHEDEPSPTAGTGLLRRFGMDDQYSMDRLLYLAERHMLPDLTVAYFMDNDDTSHKVGPSAALPVVEALDAMLGELFSIHGGLEALLADTCVIVTGDHAQSDVDAGHDLAVIDLGAILSDLKIATLGNPWLDEETIVVCPNMRSVQFYLKEPSGKLIDEVAGCLLADERVDQVIWRGDSADAADVGYVVRTRDRGTLHFWPAMVYADETASQAQDRWGCVWQWKGDLSAVGACVGEGGGLEFKSYPNAFERIAGQLECEQGGQMWATAFPGAEFQLEGSVIHPGGGSHGALHESDSTVPLLVAGWPDFVAVPGSTRTVDVAPLCLSILGVASPIAPRQSHVGRPGFQIGEARA